MKNITDLDWKMITASLHERGFAAIPGILNESECKLLSSTYDDPGLYRSTIDMNRYRFGQGEYKYFNYPLPSVVQSLREDFYPPLSEVANDWMGKLETRLNFPANYQGLLQHCHDNAQRRPTPLILRYEAGGFNTLHQDLYGDIYFPFQIVFLLSRPGMDHDGGEFVLTEQTPRAQSKVQVLHPNQGDAVIFTTNFRPVKSSKGYYRARMKHGVSEIKSGVRYSLGIIFHDAA